MVIEIDLNSLPIPLLIIFILEREAIFTFEYILYVPRVNSHYSNYV